MTPDPKRWPALWLRMNMYGKPYDLEVAKDTLLVYHERYGWSWHRSPRVVRTSRAKAELADFIAHAQADAVERAAWIVNGSDDDPRPPANSEYARGVNDGTWAAAECLRTHAAELRRGK